MIWSLLLASLAVSLPILMAVNFLGPSFIAVAVTDLIFVALLIETRRGQLRFASFAAPLTLLVLVSYIVAVSPDGVRDVAITAYPMVIAVAGFLAGTRALMIFTLLVVAIFSALTTAEIQGVLVNQFSSFTRTQDIVVFAAISAIFAVLLRMTLEYLFENLHLAESNERALIERNAQLEASQAEVQRLNDELAQGIAARTIDLQAATDENEQLYNISRDVNGAQDYVELVDAVARNLDHAEYGVTLTLYDTHDKSTARVISVVAQRVSGQPGATAVVDDHYHADKIRQVLNIQDVMVIDDVASPPPEMHARLLDELQMQRARSFMMTELRLKTRVLGYMTMGLPYPHPFSAHDIRVIRAVADLAAAAVDRMRLYREQVETAERLRDADEVKSRFMANMSHELRTPLNAILNFTRFVSTGVLGDINAEQLDALNKTIISGKHLLSLINDVLDVTKIESHMLTLFVEADVDLRPELEAAAESGEALLADKPVVFQCDFSTDLPLITGDRRRLRQILLNLISNACKFTPEGTVTLSARSDGDTVVMTVSDTGPGIPPEELQAIFEPFRQSKRGLIAGGGTGLGLAIARRLVEAHHGTLTVESAPGSGAAFTVRVPVESTALRAQLVALESQT